MFFIFKFVIYQHFVYTYNEKGIFIANSTRIRDIATQIEAKHYCNTAVIFHCVTQRK